MQLVALHNDPIGGEYQSGRNATYLYQQSPYGIIETMTTNSNGSGKTRLEDQVAYDPNHLLDSLIEKLGLKNDAALSRALEVAPPVISKIRHRRLPVGASLLIRMHEVSDLSIRDLRVLMGDRREKFRISDKQFKPKEDVASAASGSAAQH